MRKWSILLALCLLAGCAAPAAVQKPPEAAEPAPEESLYYTVDMASFADSVQDEDGTVLAEYRYSLPELTARRADVSAIETAETEAEQWALAAVEAFNDQFVFWTDGEPLRELAEMAREERRWRQEAQMEWSMALFMELDCQVYQTEHMVSVAGNYYSYTGGAHPNTVQMSWNFDLESGMSLLPEELAEEGEVFSQAVQEEILRQIRQRAEENGMAAEEMFWSNYEEIAAGWSSYAVSFDETGMTVAYSPYDLAAYAAGPQVFCLSYEQIAPYLSEYGRVLLGLESPEN